MLNRLLLPVVLAAAVVAVDAKTASAQGYACSYGAYYSGYAGHSCSPVYYGGARCLHRARYVSPLRYYGVGCAARPIVCRPLIYAAYSPFCSPAVYSPAVYSPAVYSPAVYSPLVYRPIVYRTAVYRPLLYGVRYGAGAGYCLPRSYSYVGAVIGGTGRAAGVASYRPARIAVGVSF